MRNFPGRTLEELDQMDWPRYLRAMQVQNILHVENMRSAFFRGTAKNLTEDEWKMIQEHDRLVSDG